MARTMLKTMLALCFFASLTLVACSEKPAGPDRARQAEASGGTATTLERPGKPPEGVKSFEVDSGGRHTEENVDYSYSPPTGGPHDPVWQNCGFYTKPVRDENAVHSLEHGAVWITHSPDIPKGQLQTLRGLAQSNQFVLVSPYPDLPSPVMVSVWGKQLELKSADNPDLEQFIRAYGSGAGAPEPGASCTGGVGRPK